MNSTQKDHLRQALNVIFALTQIFAGYFMSLIGIGRGIAEQSANSRTPAIPAPYAFSIWGIIFLLCLMYALYQAMPDKRHDIIHRRIGWLTALAFFGNTLWIVVAETITFGWPTAVILALLILAPSLMALFTLSNYGRGLTFMEKFFMLIPVSILAGWVSIATFANISSVLKQLEFGNFGLSLTVFSSILIVLATAFASFVILRVRGNLFYALTIIWALVAIIVANTQLVADLFVARITAVMVIIVFMATYYGRKNR